MDISKFFSVLLLSTVAHAQAYDKCVTEGESVGRLSGNNISIHTDKPVLTQIKSGQFADYEVREIRICGEY